MNERWDGKGYPDGIGGETIPSPSRIIAVCDSIDAMMTDRPYRKGMTDAACREEISKNIGVMYDPEIAKLCLANWDYITGDLYHTDEPSPVNAATSSSREKHKRRGKECRNCTPFFTLGCWALPLISSATGFRVDGLTQGAFPTSVMVGRRMERFI